MEDWHVQTDEQKAAMVKLSGLVSVSGLRFKDESHYLTNEGFPLGTVCWYVSAEVDGSRKICCGESPQEALRKAADFIYDRSING